MYRNVPLQVSVNIALCCENVADVSMETTVSIFRKLHRHVATYTVHVLFISGTDITAGRWRLITGACFEMMWSVGVVTLAVLGYICSNWRYLQLAISLPTAFLLVAYR